MKTEIKIFIADDHPIFRGGLKSPIERDPQMLVGDAPEKLSETAAEIAILDIDMRRTACQLSHHRKLPRQHRP